MVLGSQVGGCFTTTAAYGRSLRPYTPSPFTYISGFVALYFSSWWYMVCFSLRAVGWREGFGGWKTIVEPTIPVVAIFLAWESIM